MWSNFRRGWTSGLTAALGEKDLEESAPGAGAVGGSAVAPDGSAPRFRATFEVRTENGVSEISH